MNIIKYLPTKYKSKCIECKAPLIKDLKHHEIYCSQCGNIYLDYAPMNDNLINYALQYDCRNSETKSEIQSEIPK